MAAVPLFVAPREVLGALGWAEVDLIATRSVPAALFGIGIESYLGRTADASTFRGMLRLKVIWSGSAVLGVLWSQVQGGPAAGWGVLGIFLAFHAPWLRYLVLLRQST